MFLKFCLLFLKSNRVLNQQLIGISSKAKVVVDSYFMSVKKYGARAVKVSHSDREALSTGIIYSCFWRFSKAML